jgi:arylsulfatase
MRLEPPNILVLTETRSESGLADACVAPGNSTPKPNLDRLAREGARFLNWGPAETGPPGAHCASFWLDALEVAACLHRAGFATGHFGADVFDGSEHRLSAIQAFDEFFGALGEPASTRRAGCGPSPVLHCWSDGNGAQGVINRGALTPDRLESIDQECLDAAIDFVVRQNLARRPFFAWFNASSGGDGPAAPERYDRLAGRVLGHLDHLGIASDTLVVAVRPGGVPGSESGTCVMRWPARIPAGTASDAVCGQPDLLPTILAAAGVAAEGPVTTVGAPPGVCGSNLLTRLTPCERVGGLPAFEALDAARAG